MATNGNVVMIRRACYFQTYLRFAVISFPWQLTVFRHSCKIVKSDLTSSCLSVSAWYNSAPTGWIFVKYDLEYVPKIC